MKKRTLNRMDVLREGYLKGLKEAQRVINEQIDSQNDAFVCPKCGNDEFYAHQVCYHNIRVDGNGTFTEDAGIYESDNPYGPFTCTKCRAMFDVLG